MADEQDPLQRTHELLSEQRYAVLSTRRDDGAPYSSLVAITAGDDLTSLCFATLRTTRKYANLLAEPRVSLLVDDRANELTDLQDAAAITVIGEVVELQGEERERWATRMLREHSALEEFLASPGCALFRVNIRVLYLVTRFQNVVELHVREGRFSPPDPTDR